MTRSWRYWIIMVLTAAALVTILGWLSLRFLIGGVADMEVSVSRLVWASVFGLSITVIALLSVGLFSKQLWRFVLRVRLTCAGLFLIACVAAYWASFHFFVASHFSTSLRGPPGEAVTTTGVYLLDTRNNRCIVAFYRPLFKYYFFRDPILWDRP
jgi:hypothetical protein